MPPTRTEQTVAGVYLAAVLFAAVLAVAGFYGQPDDSTGLRGLAIGPLAVLTLPFSWVAIALPAPFLAKVALLIAIAMGYVAGGLWLVHARRISTRSRR